MLHLIPELRRRWALRKAPAGPLRDYLETPFPKPSADYRETGLLAVDLETTGLDPKRDAILSVGYLDIRHNRIDLSNACHRLVRTECAIPEASAVVHQITDDQAAAQGKRLDEILAELLQKLAGKVMIAHHATLEKGFLGNACRRVYGVGLPIPIIDTQALAKRTFERRHIPYKDSDLRLHTLSESYNLPRYRAHNALSDALATAELFLAQASYRDRGKGIPLRDLLTYGG
ncbi:MAG: 3'-5' exonuclease [Candidatus Thiosymbion ectosymbiont of Robbea hypermnestra]|nr:3'-5' exonuclease [Candidatus Thiosymbion ectosymbiont of Robbea hypermnestra]